LGVVSPGDGFGAGVQALAEALTRASLALLVVELRAEADGAAHATRLDLALLSERLGEAAEWLAFNVCAAGNVGLIGAAEAGEAALVVAAAQPEFVRAVVCVSPELERVSTAALVVEAPTLLVLGSRDSRAVMACARHLPSMRCDRRVELIRGPGGRFDAAGALKEAAGLCATWLGLHLSSPLPDDRSWALLAR